VPRKLTAIQAFSANQRTALYDLSKRIDESGTDITVLTTNLAALSSTVSALSAEVDALPLGIVLDLDPVTTPSVSITGGAGYQALTDEHEFTFVDGRRYRVVCYVRAIEADTNQAGDVNLYDGATAVTSGSTSHFAAHGSSGFGSLYAEYTIIGADQTYDLNFRGQCSVTADWYVDLNSAFYVEDMGAA
jgi:hypothetical protein